MYTLRQKVLMDKEISKKRNRFTHNFKFCVCKQIFNYYIDSLLYLQK